MPRPLKEGDIIPFEHSNELIPEGGLERLGAAARLTRDTMLGAVPLLGGLVSGANKLAMDEAPGFLTGPKLDSYARESPGYEASVGALEDDYQRALDAGIAPGDLFALDLFNPATPPGALAMGKGAGFFAPFLLPEMMVTQPWWRTARRKLAQKTGREFHETLPEEIVLGRGGVKDPALQRYLSHESASDMNAQGKRAYASPEGDIGYVLAPGPDGTQDLQSLYNASGRRGAGSRGLYNALGRAEMRGETMTLDAFDADGGRLVQKYRDAGFEEVGRDPYNPEYDPMGVWKDQRPDVVYMRRKPGAIEGVVQNPGGLEAALEGGMENPMQGGMPIRGHHGSAAKFDAFDPEHIGTGEGSKAYGHGLYFAEDPSIAGHYQKVLGGRAGYLVDGENVTLTQSDIYARKGHVLQQAAKTEPSWRAKNQGLENDLELYIKEIRELRDEYAARAGNPELPPGSHELQEAQDTVRGFDEDIAFAESLRGKKVERAQGAHYETEIDVEPEELLDWDAYVVDQPEQVRAALENAENPELREAWRSVSTKGVSPASSKGSDLYRALSRRLGGTDSPDAEASRILHAAGIPGVSYADANSRSLGTRRLRPEFKSIIKNWQIDAPRFRSELLDLGLSPDEVNIAIALWPNLNRTDDITATLKQVVLGGGGNKAWGPQYTEAMIDNVLEVLTEPATRNIVVFPGAADRIKILSRDGQPLPPPPSDGPLTELGPPAGAIAGSAGGLEVHAPTVFSRTGGGDLGLLAASTDELAGSKPSLFGLEDVAMEPGWGPKGPTPKHIREHGIAREQVFTPQNIEATLERVKGNELAGRAWYANEPLAQYVIDELGEENGKLFFHGLIARGGPSSSGTPVPKQIERQLWSQAAKEGGHSVMDLDPRAWKVGAYRWRGKPNPKTGEESGGIRRSLARIEEWERGGLDPIEETVKRAQSIEGRSAPKTARFAANQAGMRSNVPVDLWETRAHFGGLEVEGTREASAWGKAKRPSGGVGDAPSVGEAQAVEELHREVIGPETGLAPAESMAAEWTDIVNRYGNDARPFITIFNDQLKVLSARLHITPRELMDGILGGHFTKEQLGALGVGALAIIAPDTPGGVEEGS